MTVELIANSPTPGSSTPIATLATAVITTPVAGTIETWTFSSAPPAALQTAGQYRFTIDSEICIDVTAGGGASRQIQRGAEGSTVATHLQGAGIYHGITAGGLTNWLATNLPASVAIVSAANVFTQPQTIKSNGNALQTQDGSGNPLVSLSPPSTGNGTYAGQMILHGANSPDVTDPDHRAWYFAIDVVATTKYRDLAIGKFTAAGTASDADGIYISNGGASPASIGIGISQPLDNFPSWRTVIQAPGTGAAAYGGLLIPFATGQTGDMLSIGSSGDATQAFRIRSDGRVLSRLGAPANTTGTTGATTSGSPTLTDAGAAFTSDMVGQMIASGAGFPDGTYVLGFVDATHLTMSANATATNAGSLAYTLYARQLQFRANSNAPIITSHNSASPGVTLSTNVAVGPGVSNPTATLDVAQTGTASATFKVRTASWGSFTITANGTSPGDVTLGTVNGTAVRIGTNGPTIGLAIDTSQNVIVGPGAKATPAELAQNATTGFFSIPTVPTGAPTGTPAASAIPTGATPIVYDRVEDKLYVWSKQQTKWVGVALA